ncbi:bifunctional DNA primase/polymerase [Rhodococcus sp. 14-2496-1d]|uniref:bifunctional DNA primase/polymerase n=1 Tax=Rhodococcus sp. 14-2496-1d TaxID=2023146 RepID=UPI0015C68E24|nr:bifunctional DNA primase/polymerase [Rhodococcus sp. 14-2496-1d]
MRAPSHGKEAVDLAESGLAVLPLAHGQKRPSTLVRNGFKDATTDTDQIRRWFGFSPNANIGVVVPAAHVVLDVDPRSGGAETMQSLSDRLGELPPTLSAHTGGGGWHHWFAIPSDIDPARGSLGAGLDVKAAVRGYVVAPPSLHPSGQRYRWIDPDVQPALLPDAWVAELGHKTTASRRAKPTTVDEAGEWLERCNDPRGGRSPRTKIASVLSDVLVEMSTESAHEVMTRRVYRLVANAAEGDTGVITALEVIEYAWRQTMHERRNGTQAGSPRSGTEAHAEFVAAVRSAVAKIREVDQ